jgi:hypothetical protein
MAAQNLYRDFQINTILFKAPHQDKQRVSAALGSGYICDAYNILPFEDYYIRKE